MSLLDNLGRFFGGRGGPALLGGQPLTQPRRRPESVLLGSGDPDTDATPNLRGWKRAGLFALGGTEALDRSDQQRKARRKEAEAEAQRNRTEEWIKSQGDPDIAQAYQLGGPAAALEAWQAKQKAEQPDYGFYQGVGYKLSPEGLAEIGRLDPSYGEQTSRMNMEADNAAAEERIRLQMENLDLRRQQGDRRLDIQEGGLGVRQGQLGLSRQREGRIASAPGSSGRGGAPAAGGRGTPWMRKW